MDRIWQEVLCKGEYEDIGRGDDNFNLPLCPKCNDTKFAKESATHALIVNDIEFNCSKCKIIWHGYRDPKYTCRRKQVNDLWVSPEAMEEILNWSKE